MLEFPNIGIIGLGFVGKAIFENYNEFGNKLTCIDTDPSKYAGSSYDDIKQTEAIFVCVPSPSNSDGSADTSILENVLLKLKDYKGVIISKVTAPPDAYIRLQEQYDNLVYVPEFLTAANAITDYSRARFAIIGGNIAAYQHEAERIIRYTHQDINVVFCSIGEASLVKYTVNSFLATKVTFMNEIYFLAKSAGLDYHKVMEMISMDDRIGKSHLKVPGTDNQFGFGGMCFPKDVSALLKYAETQNVSMNVLESAVKKNTILRLTEPK